MTTTTTTTTTPLSTWDQLTRTSMEDLRKRQEQVARKVEAIQQQLVTTQTQANRIALTIEAMSSAVALYQGITREPREIIKSIPGIEFIELPEADWCCGGAGTYSITNNEISMKILERKINNIKKTGADIVATSCPACMIQLSYGIRREGLNIRVMHVNQLLALSPKP